MEILTSIDTSNNNVLEELVKSLNDNIKDIKEEFQMLQTNNCGTDTGTTITVTSTTTDTSDPSSTTIPEGCSDPIEKGKQNIYLSTHHKF